MNILTAPCIFLLLSNTTIVAMEKASDSELYFPQLNYNITHPSLIEVNGHLQERTIHSLKRTISRIWKTIVKRVEYISNLTLDEKKQDTFTRKKNAYLQELRNIVLWIEGVVVQKDIEKPFLLECLKKALQLYEIIHIRCIQVRYYERHYFDYLPEEHYTLANHTTAHQLQRLITVHLGTRPMNNEEYFNYLCQISAYAEVPPQILNGAIKNNASKVFYNKGISTITLFLFSQRPTTPYFNVIPYFDRMRTFEKSSKFFNFLRIKTAKLIKN